jgi:hypothetical protein
MFLPTGYAFRMLRDSVTGGRRAPWHSAPFVSSALRAPPLPHCAERHAALLQQALLVRQGNSNLVRQGNSGTASQGNSGLSLEDDLCMAHQGNSTLAPQHLTMPRESGWTAQRGKGGARRAEDTSEAVHPGCLGVQNLPGYLGIQDLSGSLGVQNVPRCLGVQNH